MINCLSGTESTVSNQIGNWIGSQLISIQFGIQISNQLIGYWLICFNLVIELVINYHVTKLAIELVVDYLVFNLVSSYLVIMNEIGQLLSGVWFCNWTNRSWISFQIGNWLISNWHSITNPNKAVIDQLVFKMQVLASLIGSLEDGLEMEGYLGVTLERDHWSLLDSRFLLAGRVILRLSWNGCSPCWYVPRWRALWSSRIIPGRHSWRGRPPGGETRGERDSVTAIEVSWETWLFELVELFSGESL